MRFGYVIPLDQFKQDILAEKCPRSSISELVRSIERYPTRNRVCVISLHDNRSEGLPFGFYEAEGSFVRDDEIAVGRVFYLYMGKFNPILLWSFCTSLRGQSVWDTQAEQKRLLAEGLSVFEQLTSERVPQGV